MPRHDDGERLPKRNAFAGFRADCTDLLSSPEDVPVTTGTRVILGGAVRFKFETA